MPRIQRINFIPLLLMFCLCPEDSDSREDGVHEKLIIKSIGSANLIFILKISSRKSYKTRSETLSEASLIKKVFFMDGFPS